ncbi:MAG: helix-turn-helix transcriptional regulator [Phormidesmis sp.]
MVQKLYPIKLLGVVSPLQELDIIYKYDNGVIRGWERQIHLREGVFIRFFEEHNCDHWLLDLPDEETDVIKCSFGLAGNEQKLIHFKPNSITVPLIPGKYYIRSNGLLPVGVNNHASTTNDPDQFRSLLIVYIKPKVLLSFAASSEHRLPKTLQHLIKLSNQLVYLRSGDTTPMINAVLQQILHCAYQGLVKRAYLDSKVIELIALVLDQEINIQQGGTVKSTLRPEQLERVYYAKEILLRDLSNPPSSAELAQRVGLNDLMLRQGFRQIFGTTVFSLLQTHRLKIAKQLLAEQNTTVTEVAQLTGYASLSCFSRAFKRELGIGPKAYQKRCR